MRKLLAFMTLLALPLAAGCVVHQNEAPSTLSGPGEAALSLRLAATPDSLPQDGVSQSVVVVQAFDAAGQPKSGLTVRMSVSGLGSVAPGSVVTGADGRASAVFTAPPSGATTNSVTVLGTPAGTDSAAATPFQVSIKLTQVGSPAPIPTVPNTAPPTVEFQSSPLAPVVGQSVSFNASQTVAAVGHFVTHYDWDFGDGAQDTTTGQFPFHTYSVAGTFNVLLTVTDDVGAKATKVHSVTIGQGLPTVVLIVSKNGLTVTADAGGSFAAPGSSITSYVFIWNDGSANTVTTSSIATHTYAGPVAPATTESFTVTVRAIDDRNRVGSSTQSITLP